MSAWPLAGPGSLRIRLDVQRFTPRHAKALASRFGPRHGPAVTRGADAIGKLLGGAGRKGSTRCSPLPKGRSQRGIDRCQTVLLDGSSLALCHRPGRYSVGTQPGNGHD
ncbi:hypothetical protein [Paracoccus sp. pheM1]|uniref:hypothetical protein n=1 Tax=Paracoccus sp. pheM1 TaxID=2831675 RepID=UPI001BDB6FA6|nr:hypothetical protein [Paracoccus sp. pheM1]MBT0781568.1 hypothetical protein [Paracoccus sp. pheM1]